MDPEAHLALILTLLAIVTSVCLAVTGYACYHLRRGRLTSRDVVTSSSHDAWGADEEDSSNEKVQLRHRLMQSEEQQQQQLLIQRTDVKQLKKHSVGSKNWNMPGTLLAFRAVRDSSYKYMSTKEFRAGAVQPVYKSTHTSHVTYVTSQHSSGCDSSSFMTSLPRRSTDSASAYSDVSSELTSCCSGSVTSLQPVTPVSQPTSRAYQPVSTTPPVRPPGNAPPFVVSTPHYNTLTPFVSPPCADHQGRVQISISYDALSFTLTLVVHQAVDLEHRSSRLTSYSNGGSSTVAVELPRLRIMLLPDKLSHVIVAGMSLGSDGSYAPEWNGQFIFGDLPMSKIVSRTILVESVIYDRYSRSTPIGQAILPLCHHDVTCHITTWLTLQPIADQMGKLGELLLSLCYQPTVGRINVVIVKARQLLSSADNHCHLASVCVKLRLLSNGRKLEKKKTSVKRRTSSPVYNESFVFNVPRCCSGAGENCTLPSDACSLAITVVTSFAELPAGGGEDELTNGADKRSDVVGHVLLGRDGTPTEAKHWSEMVAKPRQAVAQWHSLRRLTSSQYNAD